jgi:ADP-heptose:LPS heptosyltransferase
MRILIIRPAALGDTLMLAPALSNSCEWGEMIVAGRRPGIDFLRPLVSRCLDFEGPGWHTLFMDVPEPDARVPATEVDKVIAFLNDPQRTVKRNLEHLFPDASTAVLPGYPDEKDLVHVALYLARAMEKSGLPVHAEKAMDDAMKSPLLLSGHRRRVRTVFHPGSGGTQKNFPPEFWLNLVTAFREKIPVLKELPMVLLGPAEEKLFPLFSAEKGVEILLCCDSERLSLLLQESLLYIGQDSGVTHLAAMIGAPTIALFRDSSVAQWRPLGPRVKVIEASASGPGLVEETLKAADGFLNENARLW